MNYIPACSLKHSQRHISLLTRDFYVTEHLHITFT